MESLKIRDKKNGPEQTDEIIEKEEITADKKGAAVESPEFRTEEKVVPHKIERGNKPTIGQKIMESVKKFFEEVE